MDDGGRGGTPLTEEPRVSAKPPGAWEDALLFDAMDASRGWQGGVRRLYLIAWVVVAWNGAVLAVQASREPVAFTFVVAHFLAVHAGHVSLADLQRNSGRNDFAIYQQLYGRAALEELHRYIAAHPLRGCVPDPTDPRLQEIQDAQASANDVRFKLALPKLALVWGIWGLLCVALPIAALRLAAHGPRPMPSPGPTS
jgi:hypothetical protein